MPDYTPSWPHGAITECFKDVYLVRGTNITQSDGVDIQHSRNMTIIRNHGELTLINAIRLDEKGLAALDALGVVKHVVTIGAFHGRDDEFYLDRYHAKLWTVCDEKIQNSSPKHKIHKLEDKQALPIKRGYFFYYPTTSPAEGFIYLDDYDGVVITCDSVKNWVGVDEFFSPATGEMLKINGEIAPARISPIWLKATQIEIKDFERLLALNFKHLISAHGDVLKQTAHHDIRKSVKGI